MKAPTRKSSKTTQSTRSARAKTKTMSIPKAAKRVVADLQASVVGLAEGRRKGAKAPRKAGRTARSTRGTKSGSARRRG